MNTTENRGQTGWICPRCNKVHAPWVSQCHCVPTTVTDFPSWPKAGDPINRDIPWTTCSPPWTTLAEEFDGGCGSIDGS